MTRVGGAWCRGAALALTLAACSKPDEPKQALSTSPRILPGLGAPQPSPADPAPTATATSPPHDPIDFDGAPLSYTVVERREAAVPVVDPDQAIVQAARVSASACFTGLTGGPDVRSAILEVYVVPSGQVSRTSVSSETTAREVIDCLIRVGNGLHFSSKENSQSEGIRSFSIDVTVARPH